MLTPRLGNPNLGLGVGLRTTHFRHILKTQPEVGPGGTVLPNAELE